MCGMIARDVDIINRYYLLSKNTTKDGDLKLLDVSCLPIKVRNGQ